MFIDVWIDALCKTIESWERNAYVCMRSSVENLDVESEATDNQIETFTVAGDVFLKENIFSTD